MEIEKEKKGIERERKIGGRGVIWKYVKHLYQKSYGSST